MVPIFVATGRSFLDSMATDATVPAVAPGPNIVSWVEGQGLAGPQQVGALVGHIGPLEQTSRLRQRPGSSTAPHRSAVFDTVKDCVSTPRSTGNRNVFDAGRAGPSTGSRSSS